MVFSISENNHLDIGNGITPSIVVVLLMEAGLQNKKESNVLSCVIFVFMTNCIQFEGSESTPRPVGTT